MSDWLDWSTAWKAVPLAISAIGTLKSWRNQWAGPNQLRELIRQQWRMHKALFDMTQERDDYQASDSRQRERADSYEDLAEYYKKKCYELMAEIKDVAALASSAKSSKSSAELSDPTVTPLISVHARQSKKMPISKRVSMKQNATPRTPKKSSPSGNSTGTDDPITPGHK